MHSRHKKVSAILDIFQTT